MMSRIETGDKPGIEGLPDDGNGIYSKHLSYPDWFRLNVTRRIRSNNIEHIVFFIPFSVSLLFNTIAAQRFVLPIHHKCNSWNFHPW